MTKSKLDQLAELGQAAWLDFIRRSFITSGELKKLVEKGLRGVTSNPSIFEKAIVGSDDYDEELFCLAKQGLTIDKIYEQLAVSDIQQAADVLRPVYDHTNGLDGYVSLEVSPDLARDTQGTIAEARRLFAAVNRPNVMIKVPATSEGIPAVRTLIGEGLNINVTLMFSLEQYDDVAEAYLEGLEKLATQGGDLSRVASVASFFVSRVDVMVDEMLDKLQTPEAAALKGKMGIANAKMAYQRFRDTFKGERWERLAADGARVQRVLWASTSTKDPSLPDTVYVDNLIGMHTVNTLPPDTLEAFQDHGTLAATVTSGMDEVRDQLARLAELGIDLEQVTRRLLDEGIVKFQKPFKLMMESLATKAKHFQQVQLPLEVRLGNYQHLVDKGLEELSQHQIIARIWAKDASVWSNDPAEITNRLGWLTIAEEMSANVKKLEAFTQEVLRDGYNRAVILGMGGSSLAPELFGKIFGGQTGYLNVEVLDSTSPGAVLSTASRLDLGRTLFLVSTKSGDTVETISLFKFFYNRLLDSLGAELAGQHFAAITDPGSKLAEQAQQLKFRTVFLNNPEIGGRFSALSYFGLVPAALAGVDLNKLLSKAHEAALDCSPCRPATENPGARLGVLLAELAKAGRDKVTFLISPEIEIFADWVEQLIAESTGKSGKGILPVVHEAPGDPAVYRSDRLFVNLRLQGDSTNQRVVEALSNAGHPVVQLDLDDLYDLGGQFFLWEMAIAVAGHCLGIHPFNQPNVESAKKSAREMLAAYKESGNLPTEEPLAADNGVSAYGDGPAATVDEALRAFLKQVTPGDYVALQAFVEPTRETSAVLNHLRLWIRDHANVATTAGYGPRFLHSTGQLHKGDSGRGLFIQFTATYQQDAPIPDEPGSRKTAVTFGTLIMAQALGDNQALREAGRKVIRFHFENGAVTGISRLLDGLARS